MNDSYIHFIRQSLLVANNALRGQPEKLFNNLGQDKSIKLDGITRRAARYQAVIDSYETNRGAIQ